MEAPATLKSAETTLGNPDSWDSGGGVMRVYLGV
eukprot:CAMPEP_0176368678 /NCGR_PEP_ID=MMETSP0126-20121128/22767_1 /TAXON_ID=141414 ORGANISM="Strombidinopsis acuminatum, Strain SPMC142" /NCGR_SAMPLE_ID=MMETSP0126 /ASSEMBLY_ACC=CAM_ASM_000229 /LENGTH=33 /DNA_ID= /DNA_START= /DNA_END= /DNA_ORIENTATION=